MSRGHIREALAADASLDLVLARYAEHGHPEHLAAAIDISARVYAACCSEARRIRRTDIIRPPKPDIRKERR